MKIKTATTKRLIKKLNQLIHDGHDDHRVFHLKSELKKRGGK